MCVEFLVWFSKFSKVSSTQETDFSEQLLKIMSSKVFKIIKFDWNPFQNGFLLRSSKIGYQPEKYGFAKFQVSRGLLSPDFFIELASSQPFKNL